MLYKLPRNDEDMEDLMDTEQFKGRHQVIMAIKETLFEWDQEKKISLEDFVEFVRFMNKRKGWV